MPLQPIIISDVLENVLKDATDKWVLLTSFDILLHYYATDFRCLLLERVMNLIISNRYGVPNYTLDANEVINHKDVDAVWICSPSQFHADQIKARKNYYFQ